MTDGEKMFRAYDIRGIFDKDLTAELFVEFGLAIGSILNGKGQVVVGRDARLSSNLLMKATISGILSSGCDVANVGMVPTPVISYMTATSGNVKAGVSITASHNPPEFNGLKFVLREEGTHTTVGDPMLIKKFVDGKNYIRASFEKLGHESGYDARSRYEEYLESKFSFERPAKIVVDAGNGTTGFFVDFLQDYGHNAIGLYTEPNGLFPNHVPDPSKEENLVILKEEVLKNKAEMGIAFDGDGDRIGIVDDLGRTVDSGQITMILAKEILEKQEGARIVVDVQTTRAIEKFVKERGGEVDMIRVGYPFMLNRLRETNSPFGAEYSGHFYFADNLGHDDAMYTALQMIHILSRNRLRLSEIVDGLPRYVSSPEIRIRCSDEEKFQIVEKIKHDLENKGYAINDVDGVRVELEDGWGLVRASNTEPAIGIRFEGYTEDSLKRVRETVISVIQKYLSHVPAV